VAEVSDEIKQLFARAQRAQAGGRLEVARALYSRILGQNERLPEVHFHLARIAMAEKAPKQALPPLRRALELKPGEPAIWHLSLDAHLALGDQEGADKLVQTAEDAPLPPAAVRELQAKARSGSRAGEARLNGADPAAFNRAVQLFQSGQVAEAAEAAQALLRTSPRSAPVLAVLGAARAALGEIEAAEEAYRAALALDNSYAEAHLQLGQLLHARRAHEAATTPLERAHELIPNAPLAQKFLGLNYLARNRPALARPLLEQAHAALPEDRDTTLGLARAYSASEEFGAAHALVAPLASAPAASAAVLVQLAEICGDLERNDEAQAALLRALELAPGSGRVLSSLALHFHLLGDFETAQGYLDRAFAAGTVDGRLARNYTAGRKITAEDRWLPVLLQTWSDGSEVEGSRADLAFALGKAHEDLGEPTRAFSFYSEGNALMFERFPPSPSYFNAELARARSAWRPNASVQDETQPRVIFISGMPRSGTTLVEQIISSHSTVAPCGEVGFVSNPLAPRLELAEIENRTITDAELSAVATEGLSRARALAPDAEVVTDKGVLLQNILGFVPQVFPGSRTIIVRRDPRDNCLSMFKNRFADRTHLYTNDLEVLARAYLAFLDALAFWREAAPGAFTEIRYEDIIADPEARARELVDHCGLEWEDACLRFYENARKVKTLSAYQVRQPLYSSSVGAWRKYESELKPLIDILRDGGALEEWD